MKDKEKLKAAYYYSIKRAEGYDKAHEKQLSDYNEKIKYYHEYLPIVNEIKAFFDKLGYQEKSF